MPSTNPYSTNQLEALGQQDVGHSGVAAGRGILSQSSTIQQGFEHPLY